MIDGRLHLGELVAQPTTCEREECVFVWFFYEENQK